MNPEARRLYMLGKRFINKKLYGNSLFYFDKALSIDPYAPQIWLEKGRALASMNRFDEAIQCFDNAISLDNEMEKAWIAKGLALHCIGNFEFAILCFDRAIEIAQGANDEPWYAKGVVLFLMHRYEEALQNFEMALNIFPFHKNAALFKKECIKRLKEEGKVPEIVEIPMTRRASKMAPKIVASRRSNRS